MHCYHSCFYYCEFTFNSNLSFLNYCKFTLNCNFSFLAFFFSFLILSCAFEHVWNLRIINGLLLLLSLVTQETAGRVTLFEQLNATEKLAFPND